jgi:hypothetical protein
MGRKHLRTGQTAPISKPVADMIYKTRRRFMKIKSAEVGSSTGDLIQLLGNKNTLESW